MSNLLNFIGAASVSSSYPEDVRFFPLMFGSGESGDLTVSSNTDGGVNGAFGFKQLRNLTINSSVELRAVAGSTNGAIALAVSNILTLNGGFRADGANATNAVAGGGNQSGTGGAGAGGSVTPTPIVAVSIGTAATLNLTKLASGGTGACGGYETLINTTKAGGAAVGAVISGTTVPAYAATGTPFQQVSSSPTAAGLGTVVTRAFNKYGLVAGAAGAGGDAICGAAGVGQIAKGGGGGGGGGLIVVYAKHIVFGGSSLLSATGGNGSDGSCSTSNADWFGMQGLGGQGGRIFIVCDTYSGTVPTPTLLGGLEGRTATGGGFTPSSPSTRAASGEFTFISFRGQV